MIRRIQKGRYFFVLIATIIVFSLGLLLGIVLNEKKVNLIEQMSVSQNLDDLSLQLQFTYLNSLDVSGEKECAVMRAALEESWANLADAYEKMTKYADAPDSDPETVRLLKRNDLLNNVRYWFLLKKAKTFCVLDDSVSVLFFFSEEDCPECEIQSIMLEHYKQIFGDQFLLFHINVRVNDPMVKILLNQYSIDSYPSVVIEERKFEGIMDKEELKAVICSEFEIKHPKCMN